MVKNAMDSSLGVSLTVSAVCCPVEAGEDPAGIARYVRAVLEPVFHPAGIAVEVAPLAYMRGRTLDDSFIILDEAQNTTREQMKMFLLRRCRRICFGSCSTFPWSLTVCRPERISLANKSSAKQIFKKMKNGPAASCRPSRKGDPTWIP